MVKILISLILLSVASAVDLPCTGSSCDTDPETNANLNLLQVGLSMQAGKDTHIGVQDEKKPDDCDAICEAATVGCDGPDDGDMPGCEECIKCQAKNMEHKKCHETQECKDCGDCHHEAMNSTGTNMTDKMMACDRSADCADCAQCYHEEANSTRGGSGCTDGYQPDGKFKLCIGGSDCTHSNNFCGEGECNTTSKKCEARDYHGGDDYNGGHNDYNGGSSTMEATTITMEATTTTMEATTTTTTTMG